MCVIIKTKDIMWIVGGDERFQRCFMFSICKALNPLNVRGHNQNNVGWWFHCVLSLSYMVSWVRCGTWLYPSLIGPFLLTFNIKTLCLPPQWNAACSVACCYALEDKITMNFKPLSIFSLVNSVVWTQTIYEYYLNTFARGYITLFNSQLSGARNLSCS